MRTLFLVPIIHVPADMGFAKEMVQKLRTQALGSQWAKQYDEEISRFWDEVERKVSLLHVDRAYNDSLPIGGEGGQKLVESVAEGGSRNYQLLSRLVAAGVKLEATEDPNLLREEVGYFEAITKAKTMAEKKDIAAKHKKRLFELTEERDRYIARRIDESLLDGERGIIFLGAMHKIEPYLARDIKVVNILRHEGQRSPDEGRSG